MTTKTNRWYALSADGSSVLLCADCGNSFDLKGPSADHHPCVCPACGVECVYLDWKGRVVQVVLKNAPSVITETIRIMQDRFDELQYLELLVALEELADALVEPRK